MWSIGLELISVNWEPVGKGLEPLGVEGGCLFTEVTASEQAFVRFTAPRESGWLRPEAVHLTFGVLF